MDGFLVITSVILFAINQGKPEYVYNLKFDNLDDSIPLQLSCGSDQIIVVQSEKYGIRERNERLNVKGENDRCVLEIGAGAKSDLVAGHFSMRCNQRTICKIDNGSRNIIFNTALNHLMRKYECHNTRISSEHLYVEIGYKCIAGTKKIDLCENVNQRVSSARYLSYNEDSIANNCCCIVVGNNLTLEIVDYRTIGSDAFPVSVNGACPIYPIQFHSSIVRCEKNPINLMLIYTNLTNIGNQMLMKVTGSSRKMEIECIRYSQLPINNRWPWENGLQISTLTYEIKASAAITSSATVTTEIDLETDEADNNFRDEFIILAILSIVMFVIMVALISIVVILIKSKKKTKVYSGLGATTDNIHYSSIRNSSNDPSYITVLPDAGSIPSYLAILPETNNQQSVTPMHNREIHSTHWTARNVSVVQDVDEQRESSVRNTSGYDYVTEDLTYNIT